MPYTPPPLPPNPDRFRVIDPNTTPVGYDPRVALGQLTPAPVLQQPADSAAYEPVYNAARNTSLAAWGEQSPYFIGPVAPAPYDALIRQNRQRRAAAARPAQPVQQPVQQQAPQQPAQPQPVSMRPTDYAQQVSPLDAQIAEYAAQSMPGGAADMQEYSLPTLDPYQASLFPQGADGLVNLNPYSPAPVNTMPKVVDSARALEELIRRSLLNTTV